MAVSHKLDTPRYVWAVKKSGAIRASRSFRSKQKAIAYAKKLSIKENAEIYIHNFDGTIESKLEPSSIIDSQVTLVETLVTDYMEDQVIPDTKTFKKVLSQT